MSEFTQDYDGWVVEEIMKEFDTSTPRGVEMARVSLMMNRGTVGGYEGGLSLGDKLEIDARLTAAAQNLLRVDEE